jgi:hypothetical protein
MHGAPLAVFTADTNTPLLTVDTDPGVDDIIAMSVSFSPSWTDIDSVQ